MFKRSIVFWKIFLILTVSLMLIAYIIFLKREISECLQKKPTLQDNNIGLSILIAEKGHELILNERFSSAVPFYSTAIQLDSTNIDALNGSGYANYNLGNFKKAFADYNKAINLDSNVAEFYSYRGGALLRMEKFEEAIIDFDKAEKLNPKTLDIYTNRGYCKSQIGKHDEAIIDYNKAIILNPENAEAYNNLGGAELDNHQYIKAIQHSSIAIQIDSTIPDAWFNRAMAKIMLDSVLTGCKDLKKAKSLNYPEAEKALIFHCY